MEIWREVDHGDSPDDFLMMKASVLWKAPVYATSHQWCEVCPGAHKMKQQRAHCSKPACHPKGADTTVIELCPVKWKIRLCTMTSNWCVLVNGHDHLGKLDEVDSVPQRAIITPAIRAFIVKEDLAGRFPQQIWSLLRKETALLQPLGVVPMPVQVANVIKYARRTSGTRNAILPVETHIRQHFFEPSIIEDRHFVFGSRLDLEGFTYVGDGTREDPLLLGVTTLRLLRAGLLFGTFDRFGLFHVDATFKLSRLGFPSITCGFSDATRTYHLLAVFIVSRRTTADNQDVFASLAAIMKRVLNKSIRVNAVTGDAEEGQCNALGHTEEFAGATTLMCFFHVLYNVQKRIKHLSPANQYTVLKHIMDMHYAVSASELGQLRDKAIRVWSAISELFVFTVYFVEQWLDSKYWRWQIYHTPQGYATTNNPCEVFNAKMKRKFERKSLDTLQLLQKTGDLVEDVSVNSKGRASETITPTPDVKKLATLLLDAKLVDMVSTSTATVVRVVHRSRQTDEREEGELEDFARVFSKDEVEADGDIVGNDLHSDEEGADEGADRYEGGRALDRSQRLHAIRLYETAVKWSMKRAHQQGAPPEGWRVCARTVFIKNLGIPGDKSSQRQFVSTVVRRQAHPKKKKRTTTTSAAPRSSRRQRVADPTPPVDESGSTEDRSGIDDSAPTETNASSVSVIHEPSLMTDTPAGSVLTRPSTQIGRPPRNTRAMHIQFLCE